MSSTASIESIVPTTDELSILHLSEPKCPECATTDISKNGTYVSLGIGGSPDSIDSAILTENSTYLRQQLVIQKLENRLLRR